SRDRWLSALGQWASSSAFTGAKTSARVSITAATLLAIAAVMAEHADHGTGRHVAVTRATIANRVGCSPDTVTVAWRLLRVAGWAVEAQRGHGSPTTPTAGRRPSIYHLTPRREPQPVVHNPDLPPKAGVCLLPSVGKYSPSARQARAEKVSPTPTHRPSRRWRAEPRPLGLQRLAADLVARCHGLHHAHIGAICDVLAAAGIDPSVCTATQITAALEADMRATGWRWPDHIDNPAAFLAHRLARLHLPTDPHSAQQPDNDGGCAAGPDKEQARPGSEAPPTLMSAEQHARINTARAHIRAILTGRHQPSHALSTRAGLSWTASSSTGGR
ncbi:MAG: rep protein, partial [Mycobacterium sp.]